VSHFFIFFIKTANLVNCGIEMIKDEYVKYIFCYNNSLNLNVMSMVPFWK